MNLFKGEKSLFILILAVLVVALIWTIYDRLFGNPKPSLEEWRTKLEEQEWFQQLISDEKYGRLIENHRGVRSFLTDSHEIQRLIENEYVRKGFIRYLEKEVSRNEMKE
jgi:hypothetical protein